jgi:hypothetical protein
MTDIVERLRNAVTSPLCREAAAEIERLRAELADYKAKGAAHIRVLAVNNDELRAEIERLRKALAHELELWAALKGE